jgi:hypothetical protein
VNTPHHRACKKHEDFYRSELERLEQRGQKLTEQIHSDDMEKRRLKKIISDLEKQIQQPNGNTNGGFFGNLVGSKPTVATNDYKRVKVNNTPRRDNGQGYVGGDRDKPRVFPHVGGFDRSGNEIFTGSAVALGDSSVLGKFQQDLTGETKNNSNCNIF